MDGHVTASRGHCVGEAVRKMVLLPPEEAVEMITPLLVVEAVHWVAMVDCSDKESQPACLVPL